VHERVVEFGELPVVHQSGGRNRLRARVVHDVRRVALDESGLQLALDLLGGGVLDLGLRELLLVQALVELRVLVPVTAVEDDDFERRLGVDAERVLRGLLAGRLRPGLGRAPSAGRAAREQGRAAGRGAEVGGSTEESTAIQAARTVAATINGHRALPWRDVRNPLPSGMPCRLV